MKIEVKAKPGSKQERAEFMDGKLVVFLKEPAERGKANRALLNLLKETFGSARIVSGVGSRRKLVEIPQETMEETEKAVQATSKS